MDKKKYAAQMLFQFRTVTNGASNKRRVCEERIIHIFADSPEEALSLAKRRGKEEETRYIDEGAEVFLEFIGIKELIELGVSLESDEVWWRLFEKIEPMENKDKLIPKENQLQALRKQSDKKRSKLKVP